MRRFFPLFSSFQSLYRHDVTTALCFIKRQARLRLQKQATEHTYLDGYFLIPPLPFINNKSECTPACRGEGTARVLTQNVGACGSYPRRHLLTGWPGANTTSGQAAEPTSDTRIVLGSSSAPAAPFPRLQTKAVTYYWKPLIQTPFWWEKQDFAPFGGKNSCSS